MYLKATCKFSVMNLSHDIVKGADFSLWKVIDDEKRLQKERKKTVKRTGGRASAAKMKGGQGGRRGGDGSLLLEFRKRVVRPLQAALPCPSLSSLAADLTNGENQWREERSSPSLLVPNPKRAV